MSTSPSIFLQLLGDSVALLPPTVRALHQLPMPGEVRGSAHATSAENWLGCLCARVAGLPVVDGEVDARVTFEMPRADTEIWTRYFGASRFRSRLRAVSGELHEQLGPVRIRFALSGDADGIVWHPLAIDFLRIPLPGVLIHGVRAREFERDGRYRFDVAAVLPVVGLIVRYEGWLE